MLIRGRPCRDSAGKTDLGQHRLPIICDKIHLKCCVKRHGSVYFIGNTTTLFIEEKGNAAIYLDDVHYAAEYYDDITIWVYWDE